MLGMLLFIGVLGILITFFVGLVAPWWGTIVSALLVVYRRRYRPPEGCAAAVVRRGYFQRWVLPGRYTLLLPLMEKVQVELDLGERLVRRRYQQVLSLDRVPLVVDVRVLFRLQPKCFPPEFRPQALRLDDAGWRELVARPLGELLHNQIGLGFSAAELLGRHGRARAGRELARALQEEVRRYGVVVDEASGVAFAALLPNPAYLKALEQWSARRGVPAGVNNPAAGDQPGGRAGRSRPRRGWMDMPHPGG